MENSLEDLNALFQELQAELAKLNQCSHRDDVIPLNQENIVSLMAFREKARQNLAVAEWCYENGHFTDY